MKKIKMAHLTRNGVFYRIVKYLKSYFEDPENGINVKGFNYYMGEVEDIGWVLVIEIREIRDLDLPRFDWELFYSHHEGSELFMNLNDFIQNSLRMGNGDRLKISFSITPFWLQSKALITITSNQK